MKRFSFFVSILFFSMSALAQHTSGVTHSGRSTEQAPYPIENYIELSNPVETDTVLWTQVKPVNVS